jgi:hypothetical protein
MKERVCDEQVTELIVNAGVRERLDGQHRESGAKG